MHMLTNKYKQTLKTQKTKQRSINRMVVTQE